MKKLIFFCLFSSLIVGCRKNIEKTGDPMLDNAAKSKSYYDGDAKLLKAYSAFLDGLSASDSKLGDLAFHLSSPSEETKNLYGGIFNGGFISETLETMYFANDQDRVLKPLFKKNGKFVMKDLNPEDVFGRVVKFSTSDPKSVSLRSYNWSDSLYIPKLLNLNRSPRTEGFSKSAGLTLTWDVDNNPLNDKGVLINISYTALPERVGNANLPNYNIDKVIIVKDDGSYTLSSKDLAEFPTPSRHLSVSVYRGNFRLSDYNSQNLPLMIYNKSGYSLKMNN